MRPRSFHTPSLLSAGLLLLLGGCGTFPFPGSQSPATDTTAPAPAPAAPSTAEHDGDEALGFATRHAYYEPSHFADLPGWDDDNLAESLAAFRKSCTVMAKRQGWSKPCNAARTVDAKKPAVVRAFFETQFAPYQIHDLDRNPRGTITGYYEPLLDGSRTPQGPFVYPVYATPADMLFLDTRKLPKGARTGAVAARIEGREVVPLAVVSTGRTAGVYALELRDSIPDIRDKRLRLRVDGNRIVPYYTRADIEQGKLDAQVLAYVDKPAMLYSMQIQGSGKIRLPDGKILRLAYAEQNGHPFKPPVASRTGSGNRLVVRGVEIEMDADDEGDDAAASPLLTRSFRLATAPPAGATARTAVASAATPGGAHPAPRTQKAVPAQPPRNVAGSDPSYVFFRTIPDSPGGPVGALGVPLSAGRSVAVDPRTTPLGAPVFVSTENRAGGLNRLVMAQDTGGAVRGAVRADYFHGFGRDAQAQASRMKDQARMWVLLPKGLTLAAQNTSVRVRGAPAPAMMDCLVDDPELCVEPGPERF